MSDALTGTPAERRKKANVVRFLAHDYKAARKACKLGQEPLLAFQGNGVRHVLKPTGQHVRLHAKDRTVSARQRKKDAKLFRRNERQYATEIAQPTKAEISDELGHEIARFSQLTVEQITAMVAGGDLPFNVAVRLEQHGKNRSEVLLALAAIAKPGDLEVIESITPPANDTPPTPADSACPVPPLD